MEIKKRLFPYPVLSEDSDDYIDSSFNVEAKMLDNNLNNIKLSFSMTLDNKGLKHLIDKGMAEYIIHIECSNTAFRTAIHTSSEEETYNISNGKVSGEVQLLGMVVAKTAIDHYSNEKLNPDYEGVDISFPTGAIMAYQNIPKLNVLKNYEELSNEESLFSIIKRKAIDEYEEKPISFSFDSDRVRISVGEEIYKNYVQYKNNTQMQPLLHSLLLMPALVELVETLKYQGYQDYESTRWFLTFERLYDMKGKDFINDVILSEDMIMDIVQEMLRLPIGKAFANMPDLLGEDDQ